jgi:uncharacterized membrane protein
VPPSIEALKALRIDLKNVHEEVHENLSRLDRIALWITKHVGSMGFFILIVVWSTLWLGWNFLAPEHLQFDRPMGFVFWLFISNLIQILLMPLIMVGQNVMSAHSEARAEHDLEINIKAEQEIEIILHNIEHQNRILIAMLEKLGGDVGQVLGATKR